MDKFTVDCCQIHVTSHNIVLVIPSIYMLECTHPISDLKAAEAQTSSWCFFSVAMAYSIFASDTKRENAKFVANFTTFTEYQTPAQYF